MAIYCHFLFLQYEGVSGVIWAIRNMFALSLAAAMLWNYVMTLIADPNDGISTTGAQSDETEAANMCEKCSPARRKAPGTRHCDICSVCVIRMDHHCPFINVSCDARRGCRC